MLAPTEHLSLNYNGVEIRYGSNTVAGLGDFLNQCELGRALVVCGSNVAANDAVMAAFTTGLGDKLIGIFDGTTPQKSIVSVYDGIARMGEADADVLIGVGGGSSLDIARQMSAFGADGRSLDEIRSAAVIGRLHTPTPADGAISVITVPTTLAGADLSSAGSIEVLTPQETSSGQPLRTAGITKPLGVFFDPALFALTPRSVLYGSAMNGFNKGLETIYSPQATALSDSLALHGVRLMFEGICRFESDYDIGLPSAVAGLMLAQMERRVSIIHAVARGVSRFTTVQQGVAHAILTPHVVRYLFSTQHARRELVATALGVGPSSMSAEKLADTIIDALVRMRDSIGLPSRLGEVLDLDQFDVKAAADYVCKQPLMQDAPLDRPATTAQIRAVLESAY
ncbi:iron-containing alcohol dehydrogenase family protein [soil metagenome]